MTRSEPREREREAAKLDENRRASTKKLSSEPISMGREKGRHQLEDTCCGDGSSRLMKIAQGAISALAHDLSWRRVKSAK